MRRALDGDRDIAAPDIVEAHLRQLREDAQHRAAHGARQVGRHQRGVADPAAEQQPVVGRPPEIADDEIAVGDREVVADEAPRPLGAERLGRRDVGADRHDLATERRHQGAEIGVPGKHDVAGPDRAFRRRHPHRPLAFEAKHPRLLVQRRAGRAGRPRQAKRIVQGVKMAAAAVEEAADIGAARHQLMHLGLLDQPRVAVAPAFPLLQLLGGLPHVAPLEGSVEIAPGEIAGDGMALDPLPDDRLGFLGDQPQPQGVLGADPAGQPGKAGGVAAADLAAVAPRGAPADPRRLEQHHLVAALGQLERRRQAGVAATDDADIGVDLAPEPRMLGRIVDRGRVPGRRVHRLTHRHTVRRYHSYSRLETTEWKVRSSPRRHSLNSEQNSPPR